MQVHTVEEGETLDRIARRHGFPTGASLYDHPENAELRARRPDARFIAPGDEVVIPDRATRCETGYRYTFGVRRAAPDIIELKGYTSFAIASCVARICEAILRDAHTVMPVSTLIQGEYGIDDIYLSTPCVVGRQGIERRIELPLDAEELAGLHASADVLRGTLGRLKGQ